MHSIVARTALRRVAVAPVSRTIVVAKRYSSTEHDNDPEVSQVLQSRVNWCAHCALGSREGEAAQPQKGATQNVDTHS